MLHVQIDKENVAVTDIRNGKIKEKKIEEMFTERCQTTVKTCRSYINSLLWMCLQDSVQTTTRQPPLSLINKQCHHILQAYTHTWLFLFLFSCSLSYLHLLHKNDSSILALPYHFGRLWSSHKTRNIPFFNALPLKNMKAPPAHTRGPRPPWQLGAPTSKHTRL